MTAKPDLRKAFLSQRKKLDPDHIESSSLALRDRFVDFYEKIKPQSVHLFLPIENLQEINTWPIVDFLRSRETTILVPKAVPQTGELVHFPLMENTRLEVNKWGIPEPINESPADIRELDLVIVPLLAFDLNGYRVGYGKGFYDKFLAQCPTKTRFLGLSLFEPVEKIEVDFYDIPLHYCLTPHQIYSFPNSGANLDSNS